MKKSQGGFTLIELVVVIVLLGILGVTALGRFQDLSAEASLAAVEGVASEITAASAVNYAKSLIGTGANHQLGIGDTAAGGINQLNTAATNDACDDTIIGTNLLTAAVLPTGYTIDNDVTGTCAANAGDTYTCTLNGQNGTTATIRLTCTE